MIIPSISDYIFHSRARAEKDWDCQRSRYYEYDYQGGIQKDILALELFVGSCIHDALSAIATQYSGGKVVDIDSIASTAGSLVHDTLFEHHGLEGPVPLSAGWLIMMEQSTLVECLIRGYYRLVWPNLIKQYSIVIDCETETIYPHDHDGLFNKKGPFVYMAKPDLLLSNGQDIVYIEYKSTGNKKAEWINSWNSAIQVHGSVKAAEFTYKQSASGFGVLGAI